jgi:3-dehydroquinate synthase
VSKAGAQALDVGIPARDEPGSNEPGVTESGGIIYASIAGSDGLQALALPERTVIVADSLTKGFIPSAFAACPVALVPRGEAAKTLAGLESLYSAFLAAGVDRDWTVVGIGGGSVSDLAGFAASTWLRGIDFGFVPTTLLAMVDASIGGKNGVDFGGYKNLVGTINRPRFILCDTAVLESLPAEALSSGLAEMVKHAVIDGSSHFAALELACASGLPQTASLTNLIRRSAQLKTGIAGADEREKGQRMKLNLGHTIGHAVETLTGLPHGHCVAVGTLAAFRLAARVTGTQEADRVTKLLASLDLPVSLEQARLTAGKATGSSDGMTDRSGSGLTTALKDPVAFREALVGALKADKKKRGAAILFALPLAIGRVEITSIDIDEVAACIREAP